MSNGRAGDDFLRDNGILLPCAKTFGFHGFREPGILSQCDRPYGHTGTHMAEGFMFAGARDANDDERTNAVLRQLAERGLSSASSAPGRT